MENSANKQPLTLLANIIKHYLPQDTMEANIKVLDSYLAQIKLDEI